MLNPCSGQSTIASLLRKRISTMSEIADVSSLRVATHECSFASSLVPHHVELRLQADHPPAYDRRNAVHLREANQEEDKCQVVVCLTGQHVQRAKVVGAIKLGGKDCKAANVESNATEDTDHETRVDRMR